jgi:hypothetical protein
MKPLAAFLVAAGIAALVVLKIRQPAPLPVRPAGSWEPADTSSR